VSADFEFIAASRSTADRRVPPSGLPWWSRPLRGGGV